MTDAGAAYVQASRGILEDVAEAERAAAGEDAAPKGELVVAAPVVFGRLHVLPVVVEFLQAYPEIDIRLSLADGVVDLVGDQVDLAVRIAALPDSSLVATKVGALRRVVCGSPSYLASRGVPDRPQDLSAHDCVTFAGISAPGIWSFPSGQMDEAVAVHSRLVVNTAEAAIDAATAGIGLTRLLSYQAQQAVDAGTLVIVLQEFEPAPVPVHLVHRGGRLLPLKLRAFIDFAAPRLRAGMARHSLDRTS